MTHPGPLSDLRVVEMGQLLAGPFAGQLFADFGAELIKLEPPNQGDPLRVWGKERTNGKALWWSVLGRNKKSVTCNLRLPQGQQLARDIIATSDVLIENFRSGTLERWGMSPEQLWEINPRLVILRVTGFGQSGPMQFEAGYGAVGEAMGGLRHVTGDPDRMPSRAGISIGDTLAVKAGFEHQPLPQFPPEHFARIEPSDLTKRKGFDKGMETLAGEGAVQVLRSYDNPIANPFIAAVGRLQFEVLQYRLKDEWNVETSLSALPYACSGWLQGDIATFTPTPGSQVAKDARGRIVVLFPSEWDRQYCLRQNPGHQLLDFA